MFRINFIGCSTLKKRSKQSHDNITLYFHQWPGHWYWVPEFEYKLMQNIAYCSQCYYFGAWSIYALLCTSHVCGCEIGLFVAAAWAKNCWDGKQNVGGYINIYQWKLNHLFSNSCRVNLHSWFRYLVCPAGSELYMTNLLCLNKPVSCQADCQHYWHFPRNSTCCNNRYGTTSGFYWGIERIFSYPKFELARVYWRQISINQAMSLQENIFVF